MDPVSAKEMAALMAVFIAMIEKMGAGGLLGLILGGPLLTAGFFWLQAWNDHRHNRRMFEEARKAIGELWERHRDEMAVLQEERRKESAVIIHKFGESLAKTTRFYEDNALLVKQYEKLSQELQALIVTNIQTMGKMEAHLETLSKVVNK